MLQLYAIEDKMPSLSNCMSATKANRRSRKISKSLHTGTQTVSGWSSHSRVTLSIQGGNLRFSCNSKGVGSNFLAISVQNGIRYRYKIEVVTNSSASNSITLGLLNDPDQYADITLSTSLGQFYTGVFTMTDSSLRITVNTAASGLLRLGQILIEEA